MRKTIHQLDTRPSRAPRAPHAGVQTLVMTLWEASDVIARQFMVRFYENLAGRHGRFDDKRAAFDDAKAYIRSRYSEAYAWAAFVMLD